MSSFDISVMNLAFMKEMLSLSLTLRANEASDMWFLLFFYTGNAIRDIDVVGNVVCPVGMWFIWVSCLYVFITVFYLSIKDSLMSTMPSIPFVNLIEVW